MFDQLMDKHCKALDGLRACSVDLNAQLLPLILGKQHNALVSGLHGDGLRVVDSDCGPTLVGTPIRLHREPTLSSQPSL